MPYLNLGVFAHSVCERSHNLSECKDISSLVAHTGLVLDLFTLGHSQALNFFW